MPSKLQMIAIRLEPQHHERLKQLAMAQGRSTANLAGRIIVAAIGSPEVLTPLYGPVVGSSAMSVR